MAEESPAFKTFLNQLQVAVEAARDFSFACKQLQHKDNSSGELDIALEQDQLEAWRNASDPLKGSERNYFLTYPSTLDQPPSPTVQHMMKQVNLALVIEMFLPRSLRAKYPDMTCQIPIVDIPPSPSNLSKSLESFILPLTEAKSVYLSLCAGRKQKHIQYVLSKVIADLVTTTAVLANSAQHKTRFGAQELIDTFKNTFLYQDSFSSTTDGEPLFPTQPAQDAAVKLWEKISQERIHLLQSTPGAAEKFSWDRVCTQVLTDALRALVPLLFPEAEQPGNDKEDVATGSKSATERPLPPRQKEPSVPLKAPTPPPAIDEDETQGSVEPAPDYAEGPDAFDVPGEPMGADQTTPVSSPVPQPPTPRKPSPRTVFAPNFSFLNPRDKGTKVIMTPTGTPEPESGKASIPARIKNLKKRTVPAEETDLPSKGKGKANGTTRDGEMNQPHTSGKKRKVDDEAPAQSKKKRKIDTANGKKATSRRIIPESDDESEAAPARASKGKDAVVHTTEDPDLTASKERIRNLHARLAELTPVSGSRNSYADPDDAARRKKKKKQKETRDEDKATASESEAGPVLDPEMEAAELAARPTQTYRYGTGGIRTKWSDDETRALLRGLNTIHRKAGGLGGHVSTLRVWKAIVEMHGPQGTKDQLLANRNEVQLKDKARNIARKLKREKKEVPVYLQFIKIDED